MDRATGNAVVLHIAFDVLIQNTADHLARVVVQVGNLLQAGVAGEDFMGHVQRQVSQFHTAFEHDLSRHRIGEQVELGHRGDIAAIEVGAAHHDHFLDALGYFGRLSQGQCQVGLRAEHGDGDAVRLGAAQGLDQVVNGIAFGQAFFRFMHRDARDAFLAMDILGVDRFAQQRRWRTGVHRDVLAPCPLTCQARVARGLVQAHIAGHGGQRTNAQLLRRSHGKQQGHHIVGTRVGVDDQVDFFRRLGACSSERGQKQNTPEQVFQGR